MRFNEKNKWILKIKSNPKHPKYVYSNSGNYNK